VAGRHGGGGGGGVTGGELGGGGAAEWAGLDNRMARVRAGATTMNFDVSLIFVTVGDSG